MRNIKAINMNIEQIQRNVQLVGAMSLAFTLLVVPVVCSAALQNPITYGTISEFVQAVVRAAIRIALPILALFLVYNGFLYVSAGGDEGKITKAHSGFMYSIIGAVLILGAWVFAEIIGSTINTIRGG